MKNLKKLGAAIALALVLGVSAFAGQVETPCAPPEPGQVETPCDPGQINTPGQIGTPTAASTTPAKKGTPTATKSGTSLAEIAANVLISMLPLF